MKRRFWLVLASAAAVGGAAAGVACDDDGGRSITVVTHDSFNMSEDVLTTFEEASGIEVKLLPRGDAGAMLTSLILTKSNPEGDVAFGVDNTFLSRALEEGVFEPYSPEGLDRVAPELKAEGDGYVTPIDYGYVNFNYDIAAIEELGVPAPQTLEDLTLEDYRGLVVVENPASSSPGLAFLIATVAYFGEEKYLDWWREMRANGLVGSRQLAGRLQHEFLAEGRRAANRAELRDEPGLRADVRRATTPRCPNGEPAAATGCLPAGGIRRGVGGDEASR